MNVEDILRKYKAGEVELVFDDIHIEKFNCGEMYQKLINNKIVQNKEYQETIKNGEAYI